MEAAMQTDAFVAATFGLATALSPAMAQAQTPVERYVEVRTVLGFRVGPAAAQSLLPASWQPVQLPGPNQGVNLMVILTERVLRETTEGKAIDGGRSRSVIFIVPARETAGPARGPVVGLVLAPAPESVPGTYGVAVRSEIEMTRSRHFGAAGETGAETWSVVTSTDDRLQVEAKYTRATPVRQVAESKVYAGSTGAHRIYQTDQGVDVMRGIGVTDRVQSITFQASGPRFARIFDGSQQLVSISAVPWHVRNVSAPSTP
jgi:hypothetical protein